MMGKKAMSDDKKPLKTKHLAEYKVPHYVYDEYYKKLKESGSLYTIVPLDADSDLPELIMTPSGKNQGFLSFAFFRKEDAVRYKQRLISNKRIEEGSTFIWRCNPKSLFYAIEDQVEKTEFKIKSSFSVIIAVFLAGEFRDMEVFWTNNTLKTH